MEKLHPLEHSLQEVVQVVQNILPAITRPTEPLARMLLTDRVGELKDILLTMQRKRLINGVIPYGPVLFNLRQRAHAIFRAWEYTWDESFLIEFERLIADIDQYFQPIPGPASTKPLP